MFFESERGACWMIQWKAQHLSWWEYKVEGEMLTGWEAKVRRLSGRSWSLDGNKSIESVFNQSCVMSGDRGLIEETSKTCFEVEIFRFCGKNGNLRISLVSARLWPDLRKYFIITRWTCDEMASLFHAFEVYKIRHPPEQTWRGLYMYHSKFHYLSKYFARLKATFGSKIFD